MAHGVNELSPYMMLVEYLICEALCHGHDLVGPLDVAKHTKHDVSQGLCTTYSSPPTSGQVLHQHFHSQPLTFFFPLLNCHLVKKTVTKHYIPNLNPITLPSYWHIFLISHSH